MFERHPNTWMQPEPRSLSNDAVHTDPAFAEVLNDLVM
jgi:hypothetical protein